MRTKIIQRSRTYCFFRLQFTVIFFVGTDSSNFEKKRYIFVVVISDGISNLVQGISVKCRRREINSAKLWNVSASRLKWVCCFLLSSFKVVWRNFCTVLRLFYYFAFGWFRLQSSSVQQQHHTCWHSCVLFGLVDNFV